MYTQCPRCGAAVADPGRDFICPRCGAFVRSLGTEFVADDQGMGALASIQMSSEPGWKAALLALQQIARLAAIVLFALSLLLCFAALYAGMPQVFGGAPGSDLGGVLYILTPAPLGFYELTGGALLSYYAFLVAAISGALVFLLWSERRKLRPMASDAASHFRPPDRHSALGLAQLPQVFLAVFFFDILWAVIEAAVGATPHTPAFETYPDWFLLYTFANASVYEELMARTLLLGVPLMLAYILAHSTVPGEPFPPATAQSPPPRQHPGPARPQTLVDHLRARSTRGLLGYILGGGFRIGPLEAFFIAGSALMFGLAHASGWDAWKVVPTFIAGLAFGYLFLKVGIHAAILLHFSFDYLSLGESLVPGFALMEILLVVLWTVVGAFYFGHYAVQGLRWMHKMIYPAKGPATGVLGPG
jgi:hypothetical protein